MSPVPESSCAAAKCHEAPVFVVVVKAGIENAGDAKSPRARHHSERSEPPLRARQRDVVARFDFPFLRKLLADQQRFDAVGIARKIELAGDDALQRFVVFPLALGIDALRHHAARVAAKRQQHILIDRRDDGLHSRRVQRIS